MDTQRKLDDSSPIVQRVLRLREQIARQQATDQQPAEASPVKHIYQWQMWQKSDISAYTGTEAAHSCKSQTPA